MAAKLWAYKYRTSYSLEEIEAYDGTLMVRVVAGAPGWTAPVLYTETTTCFIYSDQEIPGLDLVDTVVAYGEGDI